jgi:Copper binding periplasmic protein CusF
MKPYGLPPERNVIANHKIFAELTAMPWPAIRRSLQRRQFRFTVADPSVDLSELKPGMKVDFSVTKAADGSAVAETVTPATEH